MTGYSYHLAFHIHTSYSVDCTISPKSLIGYCVDQNVDMLIVTDHDSMESLPILNSLNMQNKIKIIPGVEYTTEAGDIIGIFINKMLEFSSSNDLIDKIHQENGLVVLPHPFKGHKLNLIDMQNIDLIETFNARCSTKQNNLAFDLAIKNNKPKIFGNDAHLNSELPLVRNIFHCKEFKDIRNSDICKNILLEGKNQPYLAYSSRKKIIYTQIVKNYRKKNFRFLIKNILSLIREILIQ